VLYYRYSVGVIFMANGREREQPMDFGSVDLAWEFSRILAWFLKKHGYFAASDEGSGPRKGGIIDASPAGLLVALPGESSALDQGTVIRLKLSFKDRSFVCSGKVARLFAEGGMNYCGIAFIGLSAKDLAAISLGLYGEDEPFSIGGA
jgi:hypothetical protein